MASRSTSPTKGTVMSLFEKIADYALAVVIAGCLSWFLIEGLCK
jgi:hypothetical protein